MATVTSEAVGADQVSILSNACALLIVLSQFDTQGHIRHLKDRIHCTHQYARDCKPQEQVELRKPCRRLKYRKEQSRHRYSRVLTEVVLVDRPQVSFRNLHSRSLRIIHYLTSDTIGCENIRSIQKYKGQIDIINFNYLFSNPKIRSFRLC